MVCLRAVPQVHLPLIYVGLVDRHTHCCNYSLMRKNFTNRRGTNPLTRDVSFPVVYGLESPSSKNLDLFREKFIHRSAIIYWLLSEFANLWYQ